MRFSLNDTISKQYIRLAEQHRNYNYVQCEKMKYALKVMLNEGEKVLLLSIIFTMLGEGKIFLFSLLVILSLRITMGGMHRRTFWGCFFFSFGFFLLVIIMGRYFFIPNSVLVGLYIGYIIYILLRAPISSKARPSMTEATRKKLKGYSIVVVSAWISGCFFFKYGQWKPFCCNK